MARAPVVNLNLRLPPELHKALADVASKQKPKKSLNNFIVEILYDGVAIEEMRLDPERARAKRDEVIAREIARIEGRVAEIEKKVGK